ncbi:MAG: hypothetical protein HYU99_00150 [Deltaproteobacteria bacterium]|nr:hypothetical protein [Deltaproteobacteria bacterium]
MIDATKILAGLPSGLRDPLLKSYQEIGANFAEHRWEPSELNGGKFCEVVYTVIEGSIAEKFAAKPSKLKDMVKACRALEGLPANPSRVGDRSLRVLIPRVLPALYEIRNNRGVGHVGGDVDPNFLDATAVYGMASWVLAELVRIFHRVSTKEAQEAVDALIERKLPLIWEVGDMKRVLDPAMSNSDQVLLFLHKEPAWVPVKELASWVEYSSVSMFRTRVLEPLHKARLIEHDRVKFRVHISPLGSKEVEEKIIKSRQNE